jgi:hypothetical protein
MPGGVKDGLVESWRFPEAQGLGRANKCGELTRTEPAINVGVEDGLEFLTALEIFVGRAVRFPQSDDGDETRLLFVEQNDAAGKGIGIRGGFAHRRRNQGAKLVGFSGKSHKLDRVGDNHGRRNFLHPFVNGDLAPAVAGVLINALHFRVGAPAAIGRYGSDLDLRCHVTSTALRLRRNHRRKRRVPPRVRRAERAYVQPEGGDSLRVQGTAAA